jgi:hypothetical protein
MENCVFETWYELGEKCVFGKNFCAYLELKILSIQNVMLIIINLQKI